MGHLAVGLKWIGEDIAVPDRETRHLTVTVEGEERDATWKEGVGIYVEGFDIGKGDTVLIEGTPHEVTEMRRMQMEGEAVTLIVRGQQLE